MARTLTEDDILTLTGKDITYWRAQKLWREYHAEHLEQLEALQDVYCRQIVALNRRHASIYAVRELRDKVSDLRDRIAELKAAGPVNPDAERDDE